MKPKFLLLITLVLLAVQGWAMPVDSLNTHLTELDSFKKWNKFELSDTLIHFDLTHPEFNRKVDLDAIDGIGDKIIEWFVTKAEFFINPEDLVFPVITVGESITRTFEVKGSNTRYFNLSVLLSDPNGVFSVNPTIIYGTAIDMNFQGGPKRVEVTYTPRTAGRHEARITLRTNKKYLFADENTLHYDYIEQWVDFTAVAINPPSPSINVTKSTLNFGSVHNGAEKSESFIVSGSALTGDLSLKCNNPNFRVTPDYISADNAAKGTEVTVTYNPIESGRHNETLTISGGGATEVPVSLVGECDLPNIDCDVSAMYFGQLSIGDDDTKYFTVNGTYLTEDLNIESSDPCFIVSPPTVSRFDYNRTVAIIYKPTSVGSHNGTITISSSGVSKEIIVTGECVNPPRITVDATSLAFGTINLGDENPTQRLIITGTDLTNDINISISGSMFTALPYSISPADAKDGRPVVVTYKPTAVGTHTATLTISSEGAENQTINLSGKCVLPTISVNKTDLNFGVVEVGKDSTIILNVTGTNLTGSISVIKEETHGGQFTISRETLPASGGSVIVTFKPTEAGSFGGCVRFSSEGASPVSVSLSGKALELSVYPTSLNFGTTYMNGSVPKKFTVYGGNLTDDVTLSSSNAKFTVTPTTITPAEAKAGKEVTVTFKPTAAGSYSGEITISASGVKPKKVSVSGKCAVITSNPTSLDFGNVAVGKPVTKVITITGTNLTGAMSITLAETEGGQYSINKTTLPASGGTVIVTFKPTDARTIDASLKISGGNAAAVSVSLTGKGVTPTITRNKSTLSFTGSSISSDYVKVTGTNLDDVISLTVTGSTNFTVSPSTISISDAAEGKQVKVTCNPKNASSAEATLKITSPYASTKYVTLKYSRGSSGGGEVQISAVQPEGESEEGNNDFTNGGSLDVMNEFTTDVNELAMNSKIYAEGLNIIIESPVEQSAIISDISGRAKTVNLQAGRNEIPVNSSGIYIVRIREKTTKLMLR